MYLLCSMMVGLKFLSKGAIMKYFWPGFLKHFLLISIQVSC